MDSRELIRISFLAGYDEVKCGAITHELTNAEIETEYPQYISPAFAEGMIDALKGDTTREDKLRRRD